MVVTAPTTTPKPHRRWLQFSLRTMLLLVLIASVPLGWLGMKVREARQQWEAVRAIRMVEGVVEYDFERDETGVVQIRPLPADLAWRLLDLVGDDIPICRESTSHSEAPPLAAAQSKAVLNGTHL
jgi:hypothetical protein